MPRPRDQHQGRRRPPHKTDEEFETRTLALNRTARMVAGGRRFRFRAIVVAGDRKGRVGFAIAKAKDASRAAEKAGMRAKTAIISVPLRGTTIPSDVIAKFGAAKILLRPSRPGRGIRAGGAVRHVLELAGISDVTAKILSRSTNTVNNAQATLKALRKLSQRAALAKTRNHETPRD